MSPTKGHPKGRRLELTPSALGVIGAMQGRVALAAEHYGSGSPEHGEMAASLANALAQMIRLGGYITKEDDFSLLGVSGQLCYGVIFFRRREDGTPHPILGTWSLHS